MQKNSSQHEQIPRQEIAVFGTNVQGDCIASNIEITVSTVLHKPVKMHEYTGYSMKKKLLIICATLSDVNLHYLT